MLRDKHTICENKKFDYLYITKGKTVENTSADMELAC